MRPYNPCLKGMVDNYREKAEKLGIDHSYLTDEQLYRIIDFWSGMSTNEETEEAVMDALNVKTVIV